MGEAERKPFVETHSTGHPNGVSMWDRFWVKGLGVCFNRAAQAFHRGVVITAGASVDGKEGRPSRFVYL